MHVFTSIGQLERAVGTHLGYSSWHDISQSRIDAFADVTGDRQWIHTEPDKAAAGPFGTTIAHGFLTLSLVSALGWEVYRVDGMQMAVNYGANRLRFPAPVKVDSRVRAGVEILSVAPASSGYHVVNRVSIGVEHQLKPACVVEAVSLLVP